MAVVFVFINLLNCKENIKMESPKIFVNAVDPRYKKIAAMFRELGFNVGLVFSISECKCQLSSFAPLDDQQNRDAHKGRGLQSASLQYGLLSDRSLFLPLKGDNLHTVDDQLASERLECLMETQQRLAQSSLA